MRSILQNHQQANSSTPVYSYTSGYGARQFRSILYIGDFPDGMRVDQVQAVCVLEGSGQVVLYEHVDGYVGLPGGGVEPGETPVMSLKRELQEEANVELLYCAPLGYNIAKSIAANRVTLCQARYVAVVKLNNGPVRDPASKSLRRCVISRQEAAALLGWGTRGEILISRAFDLLNRRCDPEIRSAFSN